jgi:hypothetical protein
MAIRLAQQLKGSTLVTTAQIKPLTVKSSIMEENSAGGKNDV